MMQKWKKVWVTVLRNILSGVRNILSGVRNVVSVIPYMVKSVIKKCGKKFVKVWQKVCQSV